MNCKIFKKNSFLQEKKIVKVFEGKRTNKKSKKGKISEESSMVLLFY